MVAKTGTRQRQYRILEDKTKPLNTKYIVQRRTVVVGGFQGEWEEVDICYSYGIAYTRLVHEVECERDKRDNPKESPYKVVHEEIV